MDVDPLHPVDPTTLDPRTRRPRQLLVLGGAGRMARWMVQNVLGHDPELRICMADIDPRVHDVVSELRCASQIESVTVMAGEAGSLGDLDRFDAVLVGVPIGKVRETAEAILPGLRPGTWVFDICSTKVGPLADLTDAAAGRLSIIGTHPLFGPTLTDIIGQIVVVCSTTTTDPAHLEWLVNLLDELGAQVTRTSDPAEHDEYMSYVQVLTHFVFLTFVSTLQSEGLSLRRAWEYQTPPFRFLAGFAGRTIGLASDSSEAQTRTIASIQLQAHRPQVRRAFAEAADRLAGGLDSASLAEAMDALASVSKHLDDGDVEQSQAITGTAIRTEQEAARSLDRVRRTGELCGLQVRTGVRLGTVENVQNQVITFRDLTLGPGPYGVAFDDETIKAANELGLQAVPPRHIELPRRSVRLIAGAELEDWLNLNLLRHRKSIRLELPSGATSERVGQHLWRMVPGLMACSVRDEWPLPNGQVKAVTFDVSFRGDIRSRTGLDRMRRALDDFGFTPTPDLSGSAS